MGRMTDVDTDEQGRRKALRARLDASGMVVIDELTAQGGEWGTRELERIVSTAVDERRPLILTSNESPAQARVAHGDRAWSRIAGAGEVVEVRGLDYRLTGPRK
jgi:DNA replication protein DnaC